MKLSLFYNPQTNKINSQRQTDRDWVINNLSDMIMIFLVTDPIPRRLIIGFIFLAITFFITRALI